MPSGFVSFASSSKALSAYKSSSAWIMLTPGAAKSSKFMMLSMPIALICNTVLADRYEYLGRGDVSQGAEI